MLRREWIIADWCRHVEAAAALAELEGSFLIVAGADDPTIDVLRAATTWPIEVLEVDEPRTVDVRSWHKERYERMVLLRNTLLARVRERAPDWFWSLDSDILAHPASLVTMLGLLDEPKVLASSTCCFLSPPPSKRCPNYAQVRKGGWLDRRYQERARLDVHVLMANVLMTPAAYAVDYAVSRHGEDIGWSEAVRATGGRLRWAAEPISEHLMSPVVPVP